MTGYVDVYFSDHDITGPEMADLVAGTPVAGITSYRAGKRWEMARGFHFLGRDPVQAREDARIAYDALRSGGQYQGTRVAAVKRTQ